MWIVQLALRRKYTFVVMALLILVLGVTAIQSMRTDIFPEIDIPVITVLWNFKGMETAELERRITTYSEYAITSNVNDIRQVESQTLNGVGVIKICFHPGTDIGVAMSQVTAVSQAIRQVMPPGVQPPIIVRFNASTLNIVGRVKEMLPTPKRVRQSCIEASVAITDARRDFAVGSCWLRASFSPVDGELRLICRLGKSAGLPRDIVVAASVGARRSFFDSPRVARFAVLPEGGRVVGDGQAESRP